MGGDDLLEAVRDVSERLIPTHLLEHATTFCATPPQWVEDAIGTVDPVEIVIDLGAQRPAGKGMVRITHEIDGAISLDADHPGAPIRAVMGACARDRPSVGM
jgi:hypothetical protein